MSCIIPFNSHIFASYSSKEINLYLKSKILRIMKSDELNNPIIIILQIVKYLFGG